MTSDADHRQLVLVVLSTEQREAYAAELERFSRPGIRLKFEESPEAGIEIATATTSAPAMVIVGMTVGMLEGLEFVALLMRARPKFPGKIVVLPDKGDPFPPVVQSRDPATGKSSTENIDLAGIESLISVLAESARPVAPEPAPPPAPSPPVTAPAPIAKTPAASPAGAGIGGAPQGPSQAATVPAPGTSQAATVPAPRLAEKVARSPAAGARAAAAPAARPQAPSRTAPSTAAASPWRLAPRPQSSQGSPQKAAAQASAVSAGEAPVQASVGGAQTSGSSAVAPAVPAVEVRQDRAPPPGPDWLSDAMEIPVPRGKEPIPAAPAAPAAPLPQPSPSAAQSPLAGLFLSEPRSEEVARAPAVPASPAPLAAALPAPPAVVAAALATPALNQSDVQVGSAPVQAGSAPIAERPAPILAPALARWLPARLQGWRGERLAVAVLVAGLVALVAAAVGAATMFAQPTDAVPDAQSSPQNSHN
jgi:hypothetical protein